MCSQYEITAKPIEIMRCWTDKEWLNPTLDLFSSTIYPFQNGLVITTAMRDDLLKLSLMNYSLIPHWSKNSRPKFTSYNARLDRYSNTTPSQLEKIYQAPTWTLPFQRQRCIVPLNSFIESCHMGSHNGNLVKFSNHDNSLILAAGLYDRWLNPQTKQVIESFAIITDEPTQFLLDIGHDRQPLFLTPEDCLLWLDYDKLPAIKAYDFLKQKQTKLDYKVEIVRPLKQAVISEQQLSLF